MDHLSPQLQHRFLARLLSPEDTLDAIKHLRECDACREKLSPFRSNNPRSLADTILPETPAEDHPSADSLGAYLDNDLSHSDKRDLDEHLRTCELCQRALADLKSFREELLQSPAQEYAPIAKTSRSSGAAPRRPRPRDYGATSSGRRWFMQEKGRFFDWFNQPLVYAVLASVVILVVGFSIISVWPPQMLGNGGDERVTVTDGGHRTSVGPNGITNPPGGLPSDVLTALNNVAAPILKDEAPSFSPALKDNLAALKRAPSVLLGQPPSTIPFQVLSPVRTWVESPKLTFKWTKAAGATGYVVHVIADDGTQEERATSPVIIPAADATACQWVIAGSTALSPGKRYRWYVAASIKDQEVDAPGIEQAQAKFALLSEQETARLEALRKNIRGDHLLDGLLDLNAGLLDDAQADFEYLSADPGQSANAKDFLQRAITEIARLKQI
ncbi:MAG: zf-HC2 domain-containing protein [Verrucomicrobia bacterium]|nr:zf-HC2 domain-containing protein [Verrucomicrobiota bacterium]